MSSLGLPTELICILNYTRADLLQHYANSYSLNSLVPALEILEYELEDCQFLVAGAYANLYTVRVNINGQKTDKYLLRVKSDNHTIVIGLELNSYKNFAETIGPIVSDYGMGLLTRRVHGPSIEEWIKTKPSARQVINVFVICILVLCQAKEAIEFCHNDIHGNNIMIEEHERPIVYEYQKYRVISEYQPIFIDFNYSTSRKHKTSQKYHLATDLFQVVFMFRCLVKNKYSELEHYFIRLLHYYAVPELVAGKTHYSNPILAYDDQLTVQTVLDYFLLDSEKWL